MYLPLLNRAAVFPGCVIAGLLLVSASPQLSATITSTQGPPILIDGSSDGREFNGVGALSAGASSRLLIDYPKIEQQEILDYLFKPNYGANLQILKVEIGGDTNSTCGAEPSHMRSPEKVDGERGYEWWLMEEARRRNPQIKISALEWGAAGWFKADPGKPDTLHNRFWSKDNIEYIIKYLDVAKSHGLSIDYVGGWNEQADFSGPIDPATGQRTTVYETGWFEELKSALMAHGYWNTKIVATDDYDDWEVANWLADDSNFKAAVDVVGVHYPTGGSSVAESLGKPLAASEQWSDRYDTGAGVLASELNGAYINGKMSSTIVWALIYSWFDGLQKFPGVGLMQANQPWSGAYVVGPALWAMAHTTQFAKPGWKYLDQSCGFIGNNRTNGSYVTLASPDKRDFSIIVETTNATTPQSMAFALAGGLSPTTLHVWSTSLKAIVSSGWFVQLPDLKPGTNGIYQLTLQPNAVYSITTTVGQHKGNAVSSKKPEPFPLPYRESFASRSRTEPGNTESSSLTLPVRTPKYFSDLQGGFEIAKANGRPGNCLRQVVTKAPVPWNDNKNWMQFNNYPVTLVGDSVTWKDYEVTSDVYIEKPGTAIEIVGRASVPYNPSGAWIDWIEGYHLKIDDHGNWSLFKNVVTVSSTPPFATSTILAQGRVKFGARQWHKLGMRLQGGQIIPIIDGVQQVKAFDPTNPYLSGQVALIVDSYDNVEFTNFDVIKAGSASSTN